MTTEFDRPPLEVQLPQSFEVCNESSANWAVRKLIEARKYAERVQIWAAAEIHRAGREEQLLPRCERQNFSPRLDAQSRL